MQQILFEDSPYLVTAYTTDGQAFRTDRFACFQPQPDPGGVLLMQYGAANYSLLRPADEAGDCDGIDVRDRGRRRRSSSSGDDEGGSTAAPGRRRRAGPAARRSGAWCRVRRRSTAGERE